MKSFIPTLITTATLAFRTASDARAQEAPAPPELATLPAVEEAAAFVESELQRELDEQQAQLEQQLVEAERAVQLAQAAAGQAAVGVPGAPRAPMTRLEAKISRPARGGHSKALVIRSGDLAPDAQANLEEDLSVMSRIFEKAIEQKLGDDDVPKAAGIPVYFGPDAGPMRSLYLEGYGGIFVLNVRFPLLAPADKPEEEKPKSETDSAWNRARQEIYGPRDDWPDFGKTFKFSLGGGEPQEYDADKVESLRQSLIEALKNATNIRNLKADEFITVCVFGGASVGPVKAATPRRAERDAGVRKRGEDRSEVFFSDGREYGDGRPRGTVMTLRVKKADVDAFAKGKQDLGEFTKKVSLTTYPADTGAWGGGGWFGIAR